MTQAHYFCDIHTPTDITKLMFKILISFDFTLVRYAAEQNCAVISGHQKKDAMIYLFCQNWTVSAEVLLK